MARAMEFFFRLIIEQRTHNENDSEITDKTPINLLNCVDIVEIMTKLMIDLTEKYPFKTYSQFAMPMLANAILEKSVMESDGFNIIRKEDTKNKEYFATYKEIKSAGIINLESADNGTGIWYKIHLPYLWLCIVVSVTSANSPIKKWIPFIDPQQPVYWQGWEVFNMEFWALRLCLLSFIHSDEHINLEELLCGASYNQKFPDIKIELPKNNLITVHRLIEKYPDKLRVRDTNDNIHEAIHKNSQKVFVNGKEANWDGFHLQNVTLTFLLLSK